MEFLAFGQFQNQINFLFKLNKKKKKLFFRLEFQILILNRPSVSIRTNKFIYKDLKFLNRAYICRTYLN